MDQLAKTIDWLYSLEARGEIYKLERMEAALEAIGNPHRKIRAVHIAGTKGKGSVAAMLDNCLRAAGYRTGLYTKPHLVNLAERTRISGVLKPPDATPPMWNVRMVSCVPGSPIDCAAMMPTESPIFATLLVAGLMP
jgi:dihydrofolate synthase/folylpolyglutamate synthase